MSESVREVELLRRVADASSVERHLLELLDEDALDALTRSLPGGLAAKVGALASGLSALGHAVNGTPGCLDEAEWNVKRRAAVVTYLESAGPAALPLPPASERGALPRVAGQCPMGCGEALVLGEGDRVTCTYLGCPNPTAVSEMLSREAAAQRQEEETATNDRFRAIEAREDRVAGLVSALLDSLEDSWWLRAAAAYHELHKVVVEPRDL